MRGLATLLPTLITLSVLVYIWNFLWENLGRHLILVLRSVWYSLVQQGILPEQPASYISWYWDYDRFSTRLIGVILAIIAVYIVGLLVGNLIGRTAWRLGELLAMKIPVIRAIYPAVKQITDFVLQERKPQFQASRVVAVQPHEKGIWSIGLITGPGLKALTESTGEDMVTVFVPSSPTAFSGYVLVVPRQHVVELPMTVEEAMRLLISGGVIAPGAQVSSVPRSIREINLRNPDMPAPAAAPAPPPGAEPRTGTSG